jgi:hypothetical protein
VAEINKGENTIIRLFGLCSIFTIIFAIFSPFMFPIEETDNSWTYWIQFKTGSFVSFNCKTQTAGLTKETLKTFTIKEVSSENVVLEIKETYAEEAIAEAKEQKTRVIATLLTFNAYESPYEDDDLFRGYLGIREFKVIKDTYSKRTDEGTEEIEVKGVKLRATRIKIPFDENNTKIIMTFWLSDEIPGKLVKYEKEFEGPISLKEEIAAIDFKTIKANSSEIDQIRAGRVTRVIEVTGTSFINNNLRFFDDLSLIIKDSKTMNEVFKNISPSKKNYDWTEINKKFDLILTEAKSLMNHFEEDSKNLEEKPNEKEIEKLKPFLEQAHTCCDTFLKYVIQQSNLISAISSDSSHWTAEATISEVQEINKLIDGYKVATSRTFEEYKKLGGVKINYEIKNSKQNQA